MNKVIIFTALVFTLAYFAYAIFWKSKSLYTAIVEKDYEKSDSQHERSIGWVSWLFAIIALLIALLVKYW